jgi:phosphoglycolate phosphatase-like HAD superfamily hydrolase
LRPFIRSGEDYLSIFSILEDKEGIKSQEEFNNFSKGKDLSGYKKLLYKERDYLIEKNKDMWLSLNPLFDIRGFFSESRAFSKVLILTTKKKKYVIEILNFNNIDFPEENIFYTKPGDKIENLLSLIKDSNVSHDECIFVEDQVDYLIKAKKLGIRVFLVGWSYASEGQKEEARQNGIPIIDYDDFKDLVKNGSIN